MAKGDDKKKKEAPLTEDEDAFLADLKAQALAMGGGGGTANFIGLPSGDETAFATLETERPGQTSATPFAEKKPRYHVGYAYLPQIQDWDPVKKKQLQTRLVNSGLLTGDFRYGAWDEASSQAFGSLLAMANHSGNDWETELYNYYNQQPMEVDPKTGQLKPKRPGGGTLRERTPLKLSYTNPNDLGRVANEVAEKRLGRRFTADELNRFVASYQGEEGRAQTASWNAQDGGSSVEAMAVDTAAGQFAEQVDPQAATARNALPLIDSVNQMLSGFDFGQEGPMRG